MPDRARVNYLQPALQQSPKTSSRDDGFRAHFAIYSGGVCGTRRMRERRGGFLWLLNVSSKIIRMTQAQPVAFKTVSLRNDEV